MKPVNAARQLEALAGRALEESRKKKGMDLLKRHIEGDLFSWRSNERGIPNPLVRCALFSARNRNQSRTLYGPTTPLGFPIIGGGELMYTGEELRQDDETVWMHIIHLCKESQSEWVTFTPHSFLKAIGWHTTKPCYDRLFRTFLRLAGGLIVVYSTGRDRGISTRLIAQFQYSKRPTTAWTVRVFDRQDELLFLFESMYSRLDWQIRLALPEGICTWLHGFLSSHRDPFPHKIETLALGAGSRLDPLDGANLDERVRTKMRQDRLRELRSNFKEAATALVNVGFLESFEITKDDLLHVVRTRRRGSAFVS